MNISLYLYIHYNGDRFLNRVIRMTKSYLTFEVFFHIGNNLSLGDLGRIHLHSEGIDMNLEFRNRLTFFLVKLQESNWFKTWDKEEGGVYTEGFLRITDVNHIGVRWTNHFDYTEQVDEYDERVVETDYLVGNYDTILDDYHENHVMGN